MNRKIPIAKPNFGREEEEAVKEVLESGIIVQGPRTKSFEKKIRRRVEFLRTTDSNFIIMIFLEHILDLLKNPEFRDLVLTKRTPMIIDPEINNSE